MKNSRMYTKILAYTLAVALGSATLIAVPTQVQAKEQALNVIGTEYTQSKLLKGDSFSIQLELLGAQELTSITGVEVNGEAVSKEDMSYDVLNGLGGIKEGQIGMGELVELHINGLEYTGQGEDVTVVIKYSGGTVEHQISLNTVTDDEVKGALLLDPTVMSNMSATMQAGETKNIHLTIKNTSSSTIRDGVVKVNFQDTTLGLAITEGQYIEISKLESGDTEEISFVIDASDSVESGVYPIQVEINGVKQTIYLEVASEIAPPAITMAYDAKQTFKVGETTPFNLTLKNIGDQIAQDVKISIENKEDLGIVGSSNLIHIGEILPEQSQNINLNVFVDEKVASDLTTMEFKVSYKTPQGELIEETQHIVLNTKIPTEESGQVYIQEITQPSGSLGVEEAFEIGFVIQSDGNVEDVKVSINTPDGMIATSQNMFMTNRLEASDPQHYTVHMMTTDNLEAGYHPIELGVEYTYEDEVVKITQYSGVTVTETEEAEETSGQPKIIVSQYTANPTSVQAGSQFTLQVDLLNTHPEKVIKNMTATYTLQGDAQVFTPVATGNTLYTQEILPGQSTQQEITFDVSKEATNQNYPIQIVMEYEDENGEKITMTQSVTIPVVQQGMIEVGELSQTELVQNKGNALTIPLYNRGQSALENVMISLQGEGFTVQDNQLYISNFSKGATEYYLPTITPTQSEISVTLVAQYENEQGQLEEAHYPLVIEMSGQGQDSTSENMMSGNGIPSDMIPTDMMGQDRKGMMSGDAKARMSETLEQPEENNSLVLWGIGGAVALVGMIALKVVKKRKQAKEIEGHEEL